MAYSSAAIANAFLDIAKKRKMNLSNLVLQKLVYLAHDWYFGITDSPLVADEVQAWRLGPVFPRLYTALKRYGAGNVTEHIPTIDRVSDNSEDYDFLEAVFEKHKDYAPGQLIALTHEQGSPWMKAGAGQYLYRPIPAADIYQYYKNKVAKP